MGEVFVGIDVVEISRFRRFLDDADQEQLATLFTRSELDSLASRTNPAPGLAARFAAKEAVIKALGNVGGFSMDWREVEILREAGVPRVNLHGALAEAALDCGVGELSLSMSHSRSVAVAQVVALSGAGKRPQTSRPNPSRSRHG